MNKVQRILLVVYLPLTFLILFFNNLYPGADVVQYLKYGVMLTLFFSVVVSIKKQPEQKIMAWAFLFMVIADFFLVFSETLHFIRIDLAPFGMAGFLAAYIILIIAYQKNFKIEVKEIFAAILIFGSFLMMSIVLIPYIDGMMLIFTIIFGLVLSYMTWTGVSTLFRGYYSKRAAIMIAISAILMFICDLGVALELFHPVFSGGFNPLLNSIVWIAYIPGWTILNMVINEERLKTSD